MKLGLIISFSLFATLIIGFTIVASNNKVELVVKDYYREEIAYQKQMDRRQNSINLGIKTEFSIEDNELKIILNGKPNLKGNVQFYKPNNPSQDFEVNFNGNEIIQDFKEKDKGKWKAKIYFSVDSFLCYDEITYQLN